MSARIIQTWVRCPRHPHVPARLVWDTAEQQYRCPVCAVRWTPEALARALGIDPPAPERAERAPGGAGPATQQQQQQEGQRR